MIQHTSKTWLVMLILLVVSCQPLRGCVESEFTLSPESRLPKWFTLPSGVSRTEVSVTLTYYTMGKAKLTLEDRQGRTLAEIDGEENWHPQTLKKQNSSGGFDPGAYPLYVIIKANGIAEVVEHRKMEPIFYITDDPLLTSGLSQ
jgi:hypothetical protein